MYLTARKYKCAVFALLHEEGGSELVFSVLCWLAELLDKWIAEWFSEK
jgi:hypothetical protein